MFWIYSDKRQETGQGAQVFVRDNGEIEFLWRVRWKVASCEFRITGILISFYRGFVDGNVVWVEVAPSPKLHE